MGLIILDFGKIPTKYQSGFLPATAGLVLFPSLRKWKKCFNIFSPWPSSGNIGNPQQEASFEKNQSFAAGRYSPAVPLFHGPIQRTIQKKFSADIFRCGRSYPRLSLARQRSGNPEFRRAHHSPGKGDTILGKHLSFLTEGNGRKIGADGFKPSIPPQGVILDDVMKEFIVEALRIKKGNKIQAAKLLGISRSALIYRIEKYGIKQRP